MKNYLLKILCLALIFIIVVGTFVGCKNSKANDVIEDYGYGLTEEGMYEKFDSFKLKAPDFASWKFTYEDVLEWGMKEMNTNEGSKFKTVDDYVYEYGKELLATLGFAKKDVAEEGDFVNASLEFYIDDKKLEDFTSTNNYEASKDGDSIVSSFIGHAAKDEYEVEYVFSKDDVDYPGKTAKVKVVVNSVSMPDPIAAGAVEEHLVEIQKTLPAVADTKTFLVVLRPELAKATLDLFLEDYIRTMDYDIPEEFVEYELGRMKYRLKQIGYEYEEYLKTAGTTHKEVLSYCEMVARENVIAMLVFDSMNTEITEKDIDSFYSTSRETVEEAQGLPYMKLNMMRTAAINEIVEQVKLEDSDNAGQESTEKDSESK
jgi:FKBP-type peptidyl-prolyl cis-trans isomerase (trigger factor)